MTTHGNPYFNKHLLYNPYDPYKYPYFNKDLFQIYATFTSTYTSNSRGTSSVGVNAYTEETELAPRIIILQTIVELTLQRTAEKIFNSKMLLTFDPNPYSKYV